MVGFRQYVGDESEHNKRDIKISGGYRQNVS